MDDETEAAFDVSGLDEAADADPALA